MMEFTVLLGQSSVTFYQSSENECMLTELSVRLECKDLFFMDIIWRILKPTTIKGCL